VPRPPLSLCTFGGLTLERDGSPLDGSAARRRALALFTYVACHGDLGVPREGVLACFWPDSDDARARNSLKQLTFTLRRELGADVLASGAPILRVDRALVAVDALEFADALDCDDLATAVALYRGPFLDAVAVPGLPEFDRWVDAERARFRHAAARALELHAEAATRTGDHRAAVDAWRRRAALDPLSARATAGLMRALCDTGDRTAALEQWRVHEFLVREEFGTAPDPSVARLAEEIRSATRATPAAPVPAHDFAPVVPPLDASHLAPDLTRTRAPGRAPAPAAFLAPVATAPGFDADLPDPVGADAPTVMLVAAAPAEIWSAPPPAPSAVALADEHAPRAAAVPGDTTPAAGIRAVTDTGVGAATAAESRPTADGAHASGGLVAAVRALRGWIGGDPRAAGRPAWWHIRFGFLRAIAAVLGLLSTPLLVAQGWQRLAVPAGDPTSPAVVAILPLAVYGVPADSARLGTALAALVGTALDGIDGTSSVPATSVVARDAAGQAPLTPDAAAALAVKAGAGRFVTGRVIVDGQRVHVAVDLHELRPGEVATVARARATGARDALGTLAERLATELLVQRFAAPADRLAQQAARSAPSFAALRAWLEGEEALRAHRHGDAAEDFARAVALAPTFALGHFRASTAAGLRGDAAGALRAADRAAALAGTLPEAERLLLGAWRAAWHGDVDGAERTLEALLDDRPDHLDGWLQLGELQFQANPERGRSVTEARPALERALALDPARTEAMMYLARIAALEGRGATADSLVAVARAHGGGGYGLEARAAHAFALGEGTLVHRALRALERDSSATPATDVAIHDDDVHGTAAFADALLRAHPSRDVRALAHRLTALAEVARGRWRRATAALDSLATIDAEAALHLHALIAVQPFVAASPAELRALAARLDALRAVARPDREDATAGSLTERALVRQHRRGLVAAALGDRVTLARARAALRAAALDTARVRLAGPLAAGLDARDALLAGRPEAALRALEAARPAPLPELATSQAADRFLRAELLTALGRADEAARWYAAMAEQGSHELPWLAPAQRRLGELAARRGDARAVVRHQTRAAALWRDADPILAAAAASAATTARGSARRQYALVDAPAGQARSTLTVR
jgi:DNA-binding SARP family transcriptional activator